MHECKLHGLTRSRYIIIMQCLLTPTDGVSNCHKPTIDTDSFVVTLYRTHNWVRLIVLFLTVNSSGSFSIFLSVCGVTSLVFQQGSTYVRNTVLLSISSYSLSTNLTYTLCHGVCVLYHVGVYVCACIIMYIHVCMCIIILCDMYACRYVHAMLRDEKHAYINI